MMGHKNRFSEEYLSLLEEKFPTNIENLDPQKLSKILFENRPYNRRDYEEYLYFQAKLSIITCNFSFFDENMCSGYTSYGYLIWKAYVAIVQRNGIDVDKILQKIDQSHLRTDILLYTDYLLVMFRREYEKSNYEFIVDKIEQLQPLLNLLPDNATFSFLGIQHIFILTLNILGKKKEAIGKLNSLLSTYRCSTELYQYSKLLNLAGSFARNTGKYEKALKMFKYSLIMCKALNNKIGEASRLNSIGFVMFTLGKYDEALNCFQQMKSINLEINNLSGLPTAYYACGIAFDSIGMHKQSIEEYKTALNLFKDSNNRYGIIKTLNGLGMLFQAIGKHQKALDHYFESLNLAEQLKIPSEIASINNNIGLLYQKTGNYELSTFHLNQAIETYNSLSNNKNDMVKTVLNIADSYRLQGDFTAALQIITDFAPNVLDNPENQGYLNLKIALLHFDIGELEKSEKYAILSFKFFEKIKSPLSVSMVKRLLGRINFILKDEFKALEILHENLRLLEEKKLYSDSYFLTLNDLAEIYLSLDDIQNVNLCMKKMSKLLNTDKKDLLEINTAYYRYLEYYKLFSEEKLLFDDIKKFKDYSTEKKYFDLQIKSLLLIIRYFIQKNNWIEALEIIEEGQIIISNKYIITLEIELTLLKALVLANQYAFEEARMNFDKAKLIVENYGMKHYKKRIFKIFELLTNAEHHVNSLFNIIKEKGKDFEEEKTKMIKNQEISLIPQETILNYLERSLRLITKI